MPRRIMEEMTVEDMEQAVAETQTAIIPIGGTEQHGYHLPLSCDILTAYAVAKAAAGRTGCLCASPIYYSFSGGRLKGTTDIPPALSTLLVVEIAESLIRQGVTRIVIASGHGGAEHLEAMRNAQHLLQHRHPDLKVAVPLPWDLSPTFKEMFDAGDHHAGAVETALILQIRPEWVKLKDGSPATSETPGTALRYDPTWQVGVAGDPFGATPDLGRRIFDECVEGLANIVRELEGE